MTSEINSRKKIQTAHGRYSSGTVYGLRHQPHLRHCHGESRHRRSGRSPVFCPSLPDAGRNSMVRQRFCGIPAPPISSAQAQPEQIILSAEIASGSPGVNNEWPSDISFSINDVPLGNWTSPGDYGDTQGIFTPDWWFSHWNQYGLSEDADYQPGRNLSGWPETLRYPYRRIETGSQSPMRFRFSVTEDALHVGGLTPFRKNFGNYDQDIHLEVSWNFPIA